MPLPLWGELEKAQDDSTTIEQFINTKIAEHNASPSAHTGVGQSLEKHKKEDVIDHPAGSLLADKQTMKEIAVTTIFETLGIWSTGGDVSNADVPGLKLYVESGWQDKSYIYSTPQNPKNFTDSDYNMLFQIQAHFDFATNGWNANFGFYNGLNVTPTGFGFVVNQGVLRAYAKKGATTKQSSPISITLTSDHVYRAYLDSTLKKIIFHIDGTEVARLDIPGTGWKSDGGPQIYIDRGTEADGNMFVGVLNFSREL